jgi:hypothetical protein
MDPNEQNSENEGAPLDKTSRVRGKDGRFPPGNGEGVGEGWGGPPKGAGRPTPAFEFIEAGPGRGKFSEAGEARKEANYRRAESLMQLLWDIAFKGSNDPSHTVPTRVQAANHLLNRIQGMPVQMVASVTTDDLSMMTDAELAREIKGRSRKVRAFLEAVVDEDLPEELSGLDDRSLNP